MSNGVFLRGEVYWVSLDDSIGSEIKTGRPAVVVSANGLNEKLNTVIVAFLSTSSFAAPTHPSVVSPDGIRSRVLCEQIRAIDKTRLVRHDYTLTEPELIRVTGAIANTMCIPLTQTANTKYEEKIAELEAEVTILKGLYDKAIEKIIETRFEKDISRRAEVEDEPEIPVEEEIVPEVPAVEFEETPVLVDINTCSVGDLQKCGCTLSMANTLISNRPYKELDELRRVPGVTSVAYGILKVKLCCVPVIVKKPEAVEEVKVETEGEKVNINVATAKEISEKLNMPIKDAYAITGYRNKNGLFVCLEELKEVSRISEAKYERYKEYVTLGDPEPEAPKTVEAEPVEEPEVVEKVNVNTANIYELMGAGFGKSEAGRIVRWVKKYGAFKSLDELTKVDGVTGKLLRKIRDNLEV